MGLYCDWLDLIARKERVYDYDTYVRVIFTEKAWGIQGALQFV